MHAQTCCNCSGKPSCDVLSQVMLCRAVRCGLQIAISLNYNKVYGWIDFDSISPEYISKNFDAEWRKQAGKFPMDLPNMKKLYEAVDVIGLSGRYCYRCKAAAPYQLCMLCCIKRSSTAWGMSWSWIGGVGCYPEPLCTHSVCDALLVSVYMCVQPTLPCTPTSLSLPWTHHSSTMSRSCHTLALTSSS